MLAYAYKGYTIHAWTESHRDEVRGLATITGRLTDGRMAASTYVCPLLCGTDTACMARMQADINAALDEGRLPGSFSG